MQAVRLYPPFWIFLTYGAALAFGLIVGAVAIRKAAILAWRRLIDHCDMCEARANAKQDTP